MCEEKTDSVLSPEVAPPQFNGSASSRRLRRLSARFRNHPEDVSLARRTLAQFIASCGLGPDFAYDVVLAAGEALANAAVHGSREGGALFMEAHLLDDSFVVEVADQGSGFVPELRRIEPDLEGHRGFGIHIMLSVMDRVDFTDGGSRVRLSKRL